MILYFKTLSFKQITLAFAFLTMVTLFSCTSKLKETSVKALNERVSFEQVAIGDTVGANFISVLNLGQEPVKLIKVETSPPFYVKNSGEITIDKDGYADIELTFSPQQEGIQQKDVSLLFDNGTSLIIKASGIGIKDQDSPPTDWLDFEVEQGPVQVMEDTTIFHNTLKIIPKGPVSFRHRADLLKINITGFPNGARLVFPYPEGRFGSSIIRHFEIRFPTKSPIETININIISTLLSRTGNQLYEYKIPFRLIADLNIPLRICNCPAETPAPVNGIISTKTGHFPDSPIPAGDGPGATVQKVASVTAQIEGPAVGQCCKTGALFKISVFISSDFNVAGANHHNNNTAHQLIRVCRGVGGRTLVALTKGVPHAPVTSGPGSTFPCPTPVPPDVLPGFGAVIGNIVVQTTYDVPINCPIVTFSTCPCFVTENDYFTQFFYFGGAAFPAPVAGGGVGGVEIHWRVTITPADKDCIIGQRTAIIKRLIFQRIGFGIYSPDKHGSGWLNPAADPDGDGKNNYRELLDDTDPNVAN